MPDERCIERRTEMDNPFAAPREIETWEPTEAEGEWLRAKIWMFAGLAAMVVGGTLMDNRRDWPVYLVGGFFGSAAYGCFCMGAAYWAKSKGHSAWLGLLGLLGLYSPLIVAMLPERQRKKRIADLAPKGATAEQPNPAVEKQIEMNIDNWMTDAGDQS